ncbi:MAG TPA: SpoIIE family protein phosphatase [Candidatus Hydrogenedentes bacterium]|nr:SpoIIE family protein phosphatase [Candidatus Hydrogenedentota bacterium]HPU98017.1 SpoIIE family protein phosphatase [Candidatus Hydrogenedentota bacterium]
MKTCDMGWTQETLNLVVRAADRARDGITVADMRLPDQPLVYVNDGFLRLTGYSREEVIGRNCRFLQGGMASRETVRAIREALDAGREIEVELKNVRKDGTTFWNRLSLTPLRDQSGTVTHYVGVQSDITEQVELRNALEDAMLRLESLQVDISMNCARLQQGLEAARRVQRAMLPAGSYEHPQLAIYWHLLASEELAGDLLQFCQLDDRHVALWMLDVTGHGVGPALRAVAASQLLATRVRVASQLQPGNILQPDSGPCMVCPAEVAAWLSEEFPWEMDLGLYFTLFYGIFNLETAILRYVSAGHPVPVGARPDGTPLNINQESGGMPVGLQQAEYIEREVGLNPGEMLLLFSDGVTECVNEDFEMYGRERLQLFLSNHASDPADQVLDKLIQELSRWRGGKAFGDDISLMLLRRGASSPEFII